MQFLAAHEHYYLVPCSSRGADSTRPMAKLPGKDMAHARVSFSLATSVSTAAGH
jgi:hypothetical protein